MRAKVTAGLTRSIQERIETYEHPVAGVAGLAKHAGVLPVWVGWDQFLGITPEGEILAVEHDVPVSKAAPETDLSSLALALVEAAHSFPELACLVPSKPVACPPCDTCGGSGKPTITNCIQGAENIKCACGGLGWKAREWRDLGLVE